MSRIDSAFIADPLESPFGVRVLGCKSFRWMPHPVFIFVFIVVLCVGQDSVIAQEAGTLPPSSVTRPATADTPEGLPIEAFMFLDRQNNPVLMPGMTYEQLKELESKAASKSQDQRYIWRRVRIDGSVNKKRADLTVELRLQVEPTGGKTISIPLEMSNFHRRSPPEFLSGATSGNSLSVSVDQDSGGYVLLASVEESTEVALRMNVLARVESDSARSLECRLPLAPVSMQLECDQADVTAEIIGRGDEVVETTRSKSGRSKFSVESGGGSFVLRWGVNDRRQSVPFLESNSTINMQWKTPQEQLIQRVLLTVRDSRGTVSGFRLILPPGGRFFKEDPKLSSNGQYLRWTRPDRNNKELYEISIPVQERAQRIDLELNVEIPSENVSESNPLQLQVPRVASALREQGTINIETGSEFRLRWREDPYVQNTTLPSAADGGADSRAYEFEFNRGVFSLPLWLGAIKRRLDVTSECDLELHDRFAKLEMKIRPTGSSSRTQLLSVDLAGWEFPQIIDASTNAPLPWYRTGKLVEIEMPVIGMEEIAPILIRAQRTLATEQLTQETAVGASGEKGASAEESVAAAAEPTDLDSGERPENESSQLGESNVLVMDPSGDIRFPIPSVVGSSDRQNPITVQESVVRVICKGRRALVIDLESSSHLERAEDPLEKSFGLAVGGSTEGDALDRLSIEGTSLSGPTTRFFKVVPPNAGAEMVGMLVDQPPRIVLSKSVSIEVVGDEILATVNWLVDSQTDLRGRLRVSLPVSAEFGQRDQWTVFVDGERAQLRKPLADAGGAQDNAQDGAQDIEPDSERSRDDEERQVARRDGQLIPFDLVSDSLGQGKSQIRFRNSQRIPAETEDNVASIDLRLPLPAVQDITLRKSVEIEMVGDAQRDVYIDQRRASDRVELASLPSEPIELRIAPKTLASSELRVQDVLIRSAISESVQHDQLIATVLGDGEFQLRLADPDNTDLKVTVDGAEATLSRVGERLMIAVRRAADVEEELLENAAAAMPRHVIDIRLWHDQPSESLLGEIRPLALVQPGSEQLYWHVTVPSDRHLVWAPASVSRAMQWVFDGWALVRQPLVTDAILVSGISDVDASPMPSGNRYLFSAMDGSSFRAKTGSRTLLWMIVASVLVVATTVLTYVPATRSPVAFAVAVVVFSGLLAVAPDAAIIVAQVAMLAIIIVVIMLTVKRLMQPDRSRVLSSTRSERSESASNIASPSDVRAPSSIAVTRELPAEKSDARPSEVAS